MTNFNQGYLLIADITGYTVYLNESELDHAQKILKTLLELLITHSGPPLVVSKLEGDAVLSYGLTANVRDGQVFVEAIEGSYVAFRNMINLLVLNNHCQCNACANIALLDLKFFVHYGNFVVQQVERREELVGPDVILVHRLQKNRVTETTGIRAYTLYTDAAIRALGLDDWTVQLVAYRETYDHLGPVDVWVQDMTPVWQARKEKALITLAPKDVSLQVSTDIAMSPELVWGYLADPEFRKTVIGSDWQRVEDRRDGRIAPGSKYLCYHGERMTTQTILQWRPFEQMTSEDAFPLPNTYLLVDFVLTPIQTGTRLTQRMGKATGPLPFRLLADFMIRRMAPDGQRDIDAFRDRIEADLAARGLAEAIPATVDDAVLAAELVDSLTPIA